MNKKKYTQFSKRVVIAVCICVTLLSVIGVWLSYTSGEMEQATQIIKVYIQYAMVVFAAYSGNSAVEKWLVHRWGESASVPSIPDEDEAESNG